MHVDEALQMLGKWGKWQIMFYVLISIGESIPAAWHMLSIVFLGGEPLHYCTPPDGVSANETRKMETYKGVEQYARCEMYFTNDSGVFNSTVSCQDGWTYDPEIGPTIVTEWDLVCDRGYMAQASQTVLVFGVMVGAMLFSFMSDVIGRKPVFLFSLWGMVVVGSITAFVNNYYLFCVLRFIAGAFQQGIILTAFVMACELFPASNRTFAGIAINLFWAVSMMLLAGLAYLIRHWRWFQLAVSLPSVITIVYYWILPESVPWLVANGRIKDAEKIIRQAARFNKIPMPENILGSPNVVADGKAETKKGAFSFFSQIIQRVREQRASKAASGAGYTVLDIIKHRRLLMYALIMCTLWFVNSLVYYGLSLSSGDLAGDRYLNFFLSGAVEFPAYFVSIFTLQFFGRRWPLCINHVVAGIALVITAFVPTKTAGGTSLVPVITTFNMIGKFGITASFATVFLYAPELFPTTVRNQAMGIASVGGRLGNMLAPFSSYIIKIIPWFPGVLFGALSIGVGLLTLLLPETLNKPLPQTIEDANRLHSKFYQVQSGPPEMVPLQDREGANEVQQEKPVLT